MPRASRVAPFSAPLIAAAALMLFPTASLTAQPAFEWPDHPKNLRVLPKQIPKEQLRGIMTGFAKSLGVRCNYCHVGEEGKPLSTFDFSSDAKPQKRVAREMYRMVGHIHKDLKKMPLIGSTRVNLWCQTCHHGRPRPMSLSEEMVVTYAAFGIDSALGTYRDLRHRFYGRAAYDFGEGELIDFASTLSEKGKQEEAIQVLRQNVEQNPQSLRALGELAKAYEAAGQKDRAAETYRKMLEIDPQNRNVQRLLDALQGTK